MMLNNVGSEVSEDSSETSIFPLHRSDWIVFFRASANSSPVFKELLRPSKYGMRLRSWLLENHVPHQVEKKHNCVKVWTGFHKPFYLRIDRILCLYSIQSTQFIWQLLNILTSRSLCYCQVHARLSFFYDACIQNFCVQGMITWSCQNGWKIAFILSQYVSYVKDFMWCMSFGLWSNWGLGSTDEFSLYISRR